MRSEEFESESRILLSRLFERASIGVWRACLRLEVSDWQRSPAKVVSCGSCLQTGRRRDGRGWHRTCRSGEISPRFPGREKIVLLGRQVVPGELANSAWFCCKGWSCVFERVWCFTGVENFVMKIHVLRRSKSVCFFHHLTQLQTVRCVNLVF